MIAPWMDEVDVIILEKRPARTLFIYKLFVPSWDRVVFYTTRSGEYKIGGGGRLLFPKGKENPRDFNYNTGFLSENLPEKLLRRRT